MVGFAFQIYMAIHKLAFPPHTRTVFSFELLFQSTGCTELPELKRHPLLRNDTSAQNSWLGSVAERTRQLQLASTRMGVTKLGDGRFRPMDGS